MPHLNWIASPKMDGQLFMAFSNDGPELSFFDMYGGIAIFVYTVFIYRYIRRSGKPGKEKDRGRFLYCSLGTGVRSTLPAKTGVNAKFRVCKKRALTPVLPVLRRKKPPGHCSGDSFQPGFARPSS